MRLKRSIVRREACRCHYGSFHDSVVEERFPNSEISNYDSYTDLVEALNTDKIDYFLATTETARQPYGVLLGHGCPHRSPSKGSDIGAMFAKTNEGKKLKDQMDEYLAKIREDGTLDEIHSTWLNAKDEDYKPVDMSGLTGENGTLRFATSGTKVPVSFQVGDKIAGIDPDIAVRFCREYGYDIEVSTVNTAGIIPGITTGVYDFSLSDMVITDERKESVYFSDSYRQSELLLMVRMADAGMGDVAEGDDDAQETSSRASSQASRRTSFARTAGSSLRRASGRPASSRCLPCSLAASLRLVSASSVVRVATWPILSPISLCGCCRARPPSYCS